MTDFALDALDTIAQAEAGVTVGLLKLDEISPVLNANGKQIELIVHGSDSKIFRDAARMIARRQVERSNSKKVAPGSDAAFDASEEDRIDSLVACTSGWNHLLDVKGQPVPFNAKTCKEFYTKFPAARDQADKAVWNRALFIKASSGA